MRKVLYGEGAAAGKILRYEGVKDGVPGGARFPIEDDEVPMDTDWVAVFVDDAGAGGSGGAGGAGTAAAGGAAAGEEKEAEAAAALRSPSAVRRAGVVDRLTAGTSLKSVADAVSASEIVTTLTLIALAVRAIPPTITIAKMDLIAAVKEWRNEHTGALPNFWRGTVVRAADRYRNPGRVRRPPSRGNTRYVAIFPLCLPFAPHISITGQPRTSSPSLPQSPGSTISSRMHAPLPPPLPPSSLFPLPYFFS